MNRFPGLRGLALMGVLALLFGSSFLWMKLALGAFTPLQLVFGRLVLGTAVLLVLLKLIRARLPRDPRLWFRIVVPALIGTAMPFTLFAFAELTVDSGLAGVLNATTPLWALLFGYLLGSERITNVTKSFGLLLGFGGVLLIFAPWQASGVDSWGAVACLVAAACYAISYTYIARVLHGRIEPAALATTQLGMAALFVLVAIPVGGKLAVHIEPLPAIALAVLGAAGTGLAFVLNNILITREGATAAASVGYLLPVVSVLLGAVVLGEPLSLRVIAGMLVVLAGILLSRIERLKPSAGRSPSGTARTGSTAVSCEARSTRVSQPSSPR